MNGDRLDSDRSSARAARVASQGALASPDAGPISGIKSLPGESAPALVLELKDLTGATAGWASQGDIYSACLSAKDDVGPRHDLIVYVGGHGDTGSLSRALERNWRQFSGHDDDSSPETALRQVRARTELCGLAEVRVVRQATKAGLSQRAIAKLLGTSQTNVHRLLRQSRAVDDRRGPREVILCYVAGEISRGALIGSLSDLARGSHPEDGGDGYLPGTWDEVRAAFLDGLLAETDYEELRAALRAEGAGSVG